MEPRPDPGTRQEQATAMRMNTRKLVAHFGGVQTFGYAGVLVGVRHYSSDSLGRHRYRQSSTTLRDWASSLR